MTAPTDIFDDPADVADDAGPDTADARPAARPTKAKRVAPVLRPWVRFQAVNVTRHAAALRAFRREEFGTGPASPSETHVATVNELIEGLRRQLLAMTEKVTAAADAAAREPSTESLQRMTGYKDKAQRLVQFVEQVWDFYLELFGQRQSRYGDWLLSCDRIALDCYRYAYLGLGVARSIPAPPAFSYMRTGFGPATFRRGVPMQKLGRLNNPFPLIQLPYHRLVNPWTLGAVLHEVSHNLQNDLGLEQAIPRAVGVRLLEAGLGRAVAATWVRWNRETFADLSGLLLGGPAVVASLMDVVGRSAEATLNFDPNGVHPTPVLRTLVSIELLRRMGFPDEARAYRRAWEAIYPDPSAGDLPRQMVDTADEAIGLVVDTMCFRPYPSLGNKSLAQVIRFAPKEQQMIEEAARRIAAGTDPGVIPERFLIGATRFALEHRLARPGVLADNFYKELVRR